MSGNTFGRIFRLTTFGESHGKGVGGILEGCPAGLLIDEAMVRYHMSRRRPGQSSLTTTRNEDDEVEFLSGIFQSKTTGTPIGFLVRNKDQRSDDYEPLKDIFRPGHADETWQQKYGIRDYRGGGRSSARETLSRVIGGTIARIYLSQHGISIQAYVSSVKDVDLDKPYHELNLDLTESNEVRCPDAEISVRMKAVIESARDNGDSVGGTITCVTRGLPAGLGEPVFDKIHALLGHAMLSINAVKGFEIGDGFSATKRFGSENNLIPAGVYGGISSGEDMVCRVAFKPVSTISKKQLAKTVEGNEVELSATGRHDPCVLPRAVVIVESMAALVIADALLLSKAGTVS
jgi:chorismate synthase